MDQGTVAVELAYFPVAEDDRSMVDSAHILVVDDDVEIRQLISSYLQSHGFSVDTAKSGEEMDSMMSRRTPDLVVLDVMMPGEDGLTICRRFAAEGGPAVIMMSALGEETDRVVGLELGADDYLQKPCYPRELLARIKAVLRRRALHDSDGADRKGTAYLFGGWTLDLVRRQLTSPEGKAIGVSAREFSLLRIFLERPLRVLTRDQLLNLTRGIDVDVYDRSIDVQISRLRKKLQGAEGDIIETVRNEGYLFALKPVLR